MSSRKGVDNSSHAVKKFGRGRPWVQPNPPPKAWGQPDTAHRLGIRSCYASNRNSAVKGGSSQLREEEEEVDERRIICSVGYDIVWPPMVMIMNTLLDTDDNDKGTGRSEWDNSRRALFCAGGKRQLYGFLARKDDLDEFNKHSQGKARLKYEIRSYQEIVVVPKKQMSEDIQQLTWFKKKSALYQRVNKAKEEMLNILREKFWKLLNDYRIMREKINELHEENKEEMIFQEQFFNDQIQEIHEATNVKEDQFEKLQEERKKIEDFEKVPSITVDGRHRAEEETKFKKMQNQEVEKYLIEREQLEQIRNGKKIEMKKRHWEEEVELEREFDAALTELMSKYAPRPTKDDVSAGTGAIA